MSKGSKTKLATFRKKYTKMNYTRTYFACLNDFNFKMRYGKKHSGHPTVNILTVVPLWPKSNIFTP